MSSWESLPIFSGLPQYEVMHALEQFERLDVEAGTELIAEGDDDPTGVIVVSGELQILLGNTVLGRATTGDVVGEIALFAGGLRTASVVAIQFSTLLVLSREGYERLRAERHPVAAALEEHALAQMSARLRRMRDRLSAKAAGKRAITRPAPGFFERVSSMFGGGGVAPVKIDAAAVLQKSRLFDGVPRELLEPVAQRMEALQFRAGHMLCTEGEAGDEMFIIASGTVDVVCQTQMGGVESLASLGPGDATGMCSLVQPDKARMASCVARDKVVALSLSQLQWASLVHGADWVGSILRVAMIRALAESIESANTQLAELDVAGDTMALRRVAAATETVRLQAGGSLPSYFEQGS